MDHCETDGKCVHLTDTATWQNSVQNVFDGDCALCLDMARSPLAGWSPASFPSLAEAFSGMITFTQVVVDRRCTLPGHVVAMLKPLLRAKDEFSYPTEGTSWGTTGIRPDCLTIRATGWATGCHWVTSNASDVQLACRKRERDPSFHPISQCRAEFRIESECLRQVFALQMHRSRAPNPKCFLQNSRDLGQEKQTSPC